MTIKNKRMRKAGLAFFCSTSLCTFINLISLTSIKARNSPAKRHVLWNFLICGMQVVTSLAAVNYGKRLAKQGKMIDKWYSMDVLPDDITGEDLSDVVFVTYDGCLYNGHYNRDNQIFHSYVGLDFNLNEIAAWTDQDITSQFKRPQPMPEE